MSVAPIQYVVIGRGRFGIKLCRELVGRGLEVHALTMKSEFPMDLVEEVRDLRTLDYTSPVALKQFVDQMEGETYYFIAIGNSFENSLSVAACLRSFEVEHLYVRVINENHAQLINLLGLNPIDLASSTASTFASLIRSPKFRRAIPVDENYTVAEMELPLAYIGASLKQIPLRQEFKLNLVSFRRDGVYCGTPGPNTVFREGDLLLLYGQEDELLVFANTDDEELQAGLERRKKELEK
jgi:trk system potassium uptake protein TrkA